MVSQIAANVDWAAAAERRSWLEQLLGRQPAGLAGPLSAAHERAGAHVERHSLWLQNSVRGAVGLGLAVLVANLTGVQHAFWVVLGTLSVLRSNALSTGENVLRGLLGTVAGFVVGGVLVVLIGTNTTAAVAAAPLRRPARRPRSRGDLVRRRPGRVHAHAADPLQHPGARGLGDRAGADRGHRAGQRGQPRGRACCSGRAAPVPRSARRWPRPTPTAPATSRAPSSSASGAATPSPQPAARTDRGGAARRGGRTPPRRHLPQLPRRARRQADPARRGDQPGHRRRRPAPRRRRRARPVAIRRRRRAATGRRPGTSWWRAPSR